MQTRQYPLSRELIRDCLSLSSGTIATLTGHADYATIDRIHCEFALWVVAHPDYDTWQHAWTAFREEVQS